MDALPLTPAEVALVFAPALAAYAGLTAMVVISWSSRARGAPPSRRWRVVAWATLVAMTAHVALLWSLRYGFDPARATRNGWTGFLTFHAALAGSWLVLWRDWRGSAGARATLLGVWLVVTSGAVPAPFRYDIVAPLAPVVIAIAASGALGLGVAALRRRRARTLR